MPQVRVVQKGKSSFHQLLEDDFVKIAGKLVPVGKIEPRWSWQTWFPFYVLEGPIHYVWVLRINESLSSAWKLSLEIAKEPCEWRDPKENGTSIAYGIDSLHSLSYAYGEKLVADRLLYRNREIQKVFVPVSMPTTLRLRILRHIERLDLRVVESTDRLRITVDRRSQC